jgi:hypothetical protein
MISPRRLATRIVVCAALVCLVCVVSPSARAAEALTNESVIEMVKLGLGEPVIIKKIKSGPTAFDTGISGLKALKQAGVSDAVIEAMMSATEAAEQAASASAAAAAARPAWVPKKPGIYMDRGASGDTPALERIEPTSYEIDQDSGFATRMFAGAKTKTRIRIIGASSATTIPSAEPAFYFVFDSSKEKPAEQAPATDPMSQAMAMMTQMQGGQSATSPKQFALVKLEKKKNSREFVAGAYSGFGAQSGVEDDAVVQFDFDEVGEGIYRIQARTPLGPGEYCFYFVSPNPKGASAFAGSPNSLYDFSRR